MLKRVLFLVVLVALLAGVSPADEGMWLYNHPPVKRLKKKYKFTPTKPWLDHLRLGSVRLNSGGSGSFVSPNGLVFTNHHVASDCLAKLTSAEHDYMKTGFYAKTQAEEVKCPDLEVNQLTGIEDVTAKVNADVKPGMSTADVGKAQRAAMAQLEKACATAADIRCDVVTLYSGAEYHLYKYKRYTDLRVVFAPEFAAAFFGGDHDNFEYPRYDLDIAFFRVYENDKPIHLDTDSYLHFSATGAKPGDLVFVSGHPGSTGRLLTMSQLEFLRDTDQPFRIEYYRGITKMLHAFADQSPENDRMAHEDIFGLENSIKARVGFLGGLQDKELMATKQQNETKLRNAVNASPKMKADFGQAWDELDKAMQVQKEIYPKMNFLERMGFLPGEMAGYARMLVRVTAEKEKPNGERLREYRDSALPSLEQSLFSTAPVYKSYETLLLTHWLENMQKTLGADDDSVKKALNGKSPADAAKAYIDGSKLDQPDVRKQLYDGGAKAVAASDDPLIVLMRNIDPEARAVRKRFDDEVDAVQRRDGALIAKATFEANKGEETYPDATFTLRLSYGTVEGFIEDGRGNVAKKGEHVAPFTDMGGAFQHADENGNQGDFKLADSWMQHKGDLDLKTPLNFTSTPDIIGGNSGSPVVDRNGQVLGIIFDGNIQSLPWNYQYEDKIGRSVSVDVRGIIEALRKIYHADELAKELTIAPPKPYMAAPGHAADTNKPAKEVKTPKK